MLTAFDEQVRRHPDGDGRVEHDRGVIRCVSDAAGWNGVTWSDLDDGNADAVIAAQLARFAEISAPWEWKHYSYDQPPDLPDRLVAAGFTREPAETLLVAEIADLALDVPPPAGVELRAVVDQQGVDAVVAVHDEVFGEDHSALGAVLARSLTERPRRVEALIAVAGETPIAAGRVAVPSRHATSPACGAAARCPRGEAAACSARSSPAGPRWRPPAASATSRSTPRPRAGRSWSGSASSSSPRPRRSCIQGRFRRRCVCCPSS